MSGTLKAQRGAGGGGLSHEETLLAVAAPLTKGSAAGEGVNAPGRRQEDDVNLVPVEPQTLDWQMGGVRRLTPTECERLQGLPDGWTQLGGTPDSRRYSALGDAVTATVAEWIGGRLWRG